MSCSLNARRRHPRLRNRHAR